MPPLSTETSSNLTVPESSIEACSSAGNSVTHGGHQVAQKLTSKGVPRKSCNLNTAPSLSIIGAIIGGVGAAAGADGLAAKTGENKPKLVPPVTARSDVTKQRRVENADFG